MTKKSNKCSLEEHIKSVEALIDEIDKCDIPTECENCDQLWECHAHTRTMVKFLLTIRVDNLKHKPEDLVKQAKEKMKQKVKEIEDYTAEMSYI